MLKKGIITLAFAIISTILFSQSADEPFKKANTIIIETQMDVNDVFLKWGRHLSQNGYSIEKSNRDFYTISTGPKDTSKLNFDFVINSSISDSGTLILKLKWRLKSNLLTNTSETGFYDWEYAKSKGNIQNVIYRDILPIISSFGDFNIIYEKQ